MPRRIPLSDVRLALQADRAELIRHLHTRRVGCMVGPTEPGGWVVLILDSDANPAPLARELSTTVSPVVLTAVTDSTGEHLELRAWQRGTLPPTQDLRAIATAVGAPPVTDDPSEPGELAADRLERIARRLGLPPTLVDQVTTSALVLHRGRPEDVRMVATIGGPAWIMARSGWHILVPVQQPGPAGRPGAIASGLAGGLSSMKRRSRTFLLWYDGRGICGYVWWRKGRPVDGHQWNSPWQRIPEPGPDDEHGDVGLLVQAVDRPEHTVLLRALLRRAGNAAELLQEFTSLTGLPAEAVDLLLGRQSPELLPDAELIEKRPFRSAFGNYLRTPLSRPATLAMAIAAALGALVFILLTLVGLVVLVSNGAFADQPGRTSADWAFLAFSIAMTIGTSWFAISRLRSARRPRQEALPTPAEKAQP